MRTKKLIIGCTEPSAFTNDVLNMIEKFYHGNPIKLCQNSKNDLNYWLKQCDAVVLAGGVDIHPRTYGYSVLNNYGFSRFDIKRDIRELHIIDYCIKNEIPILGICRGHQMLGVYHRIQMVVDLSNSLVCHQPNYQKINTEKDEPMHWVALTPNAKKDFETIDSSETNYPYNASSDTRYLWVNSFHHQGLQNSDKISDKVSVLGTSPGLKKEQIIEFMMGTQALWMSTQWHPEYDWEANPASLMVLSRFKEMIQKDEERLTFQRLYQRIKLNKELLENSASKNNQ